MDRRVLVDSSAIIALLNRRDQNHRRATRTWEGLVGKKTLLLVPDYVLGEVVTYFKRFSFAGCRAAVEWLTKLQRANVVEVVFPEGETWIDAMNGVLALPDPGYPLFDAVTVAIARRERIPSVFSYDRVFSQLGFPSP